MSSTRRYGGVHQSQKHRGLKSYTLISLGVISYPLPVKRIYAAKIQTFFNHAVKIFDQFIIILSKHPLHPLHRLNHHTSLTCQVDAQTLFCSELLAVVQT